MFFSNRFRKKVAFLLVFSGITLCLNCTSSKVSAMRTAQIIEKHKEHILNSMCGKLDAFKLESLHDCSKADYPKNDSDYFLNLFAAILFKFPTDLTNWEVNRSRLLKTIVSDREVSERHMDMARIIAKVAEAQVGTSKEELIKVKDVLLNIQCELRDSSNANTFAVKPFGKSKGQDRVIKEMIDEGLDELYGTPLTSSNSSCDLWGLSSSGGI